MSEKIECKCLQWINQNGILRAMAIEIYKEGGKYCPYCGAKYAVEHVLTVQSSKIGVSSEFQKR